MVTNSICVGCRKKASIKSSYEKKQYCDECFARMLEKRVRKDIRAGGKIKPGDKIELLDDSSKEFETVKILLRNIFGEHLKIKEVKAVGSKTFIPTNLDREIKDGLEVYLENKNFIGRKTLLHNVLEKEIIEFCRIHKIKVNDKSSGNELIENIEKIYPGTKFALAKSLRKILR